MAVIYEIGYNNLPYKGKIFFTSKWIFLLFDSDSSLSFDSSQK